MVTAAISSTDSTIVVNYNNQEQQGTMIVSSLVAAGTNLSTSDPRPNHLVDGDTTTLPQHSSTTAATTTTTMLEERSLGVITTDEEEEEIHHHEEVEGEDDSDSVVSDDGSGSNSIVSESSRASSTSSSSSTNTVPLWTIWLCTSINYCCCCCCLYPTCPSILHYLAKLWIRFLCGPIVVVGMIGILLLFIVFFAFPVFLFLILLILLYYCCTVDPISPSVLWFALWYDDPTLLPMTNNNNNNRSTPGISPMGDTGGADRYWDNMMMTNMGNGTNPQGDGNNGLLPLWGYYNGSIVRQYSPQQIQQSLIRRELLYIQDKTQKDPVPTFWDYHTDDEYQQDRQCTEIVDKDDHHEEQHDQEDIENVMSISTRQEMEKEGTNPKRKKRSYPCDCIHHHDHTDKSNNHKNVNNKKSINNNNKKKRDKHGTSNLHDQLQIPIGSYMFYFSSPLPLPVVPPPMEVSPSTTTTTSDGLNFRSHDVNSIVGRVPPIPPQPIQQQQQQGNVNPYRYRFHASSFSPNTTTTNNNNNNHTMSRNSTDIRASNNLSSINNHSSRGFSGSSNRWFSSPRAAAISSSTLNNNQSDNDDDRVITEPQGDLVGLELTQRSTHPLEQQQQQLQIMGNTRVDRSWERTTIRPSLLHPHPWLIGGSDDDASSEVPPPSIVFDHDVTDISFVIESSMNHPNYHNDNYLNDYDYNDLDDAASSEIAPPSIILGSTEHRDDIIDDNDSPMDNDFVVAAAASATTSANGDFAIAASDVSSTSSMFLTSQSVCSQDNEEEITTSRTETARTCAHHCKSVSIENSESAERHHPVSGSRGITRDESNGNEHTNENRKNNSNAKSIDNENIPTSRDRGSNGEDDHIVDHVDDSNTNDDGDDDDASTSKMTCDICMVEYEVGDVVAWSQNPSCRHAFHEGCITDWCLRKPSCPSCRQNYVVTKQSRLSVSEWPFR